MLKYNKKSIDLENCNTFLKRLLGFMGQRNINKALLFENCNSIHTFFMKENIDVIMCDKNNKVVYFYKNLTKRKIIFPKKNVAKVIETPAYYFDIKINTNIIIE